MAHHPNVRIAIGALICVKDEGRVPLRGDRGGLILQQVGQLREIDGDPSCLIHVTDRKPDECTKKLGLQNQKATVWSVMGHLSQVVNERPMLRIASVVLAFCCATPLVWLFSNLVVYGLRSFL
jgi:hypothetical protein